MGTRKDDIMKFESDFTLPPDDYLVRDRATPLKNDLLELKTALSRLVDDQKSEALYLMGKIQAHLGDSSAALESLTKAIEISPQGRYFYQRGKVTHSTNRKTFRKFIKKHWN